MGAIVNEFLNEDVVGTSGRGFAFEVLDAKADLAHEKLVTDLLDIEMLPAAIGGGATSFDEDGKIDEHYSRGVPHQSVMKTLEA